MAKKKKHNRNDPKINKWGFTHSGENDTVIGGGLNFPTGTGVNAIGVIPKNYDRVFKGVGSLGVNQRMGNVNLGAKVDTPFLYDYESGVRLPNTYNPSLTGEWKNTLGDFDLKAKIESPLTNQNRQEGVSNLERLRGEFNVRYNIPASKKKSLGKKLESGGTLAPNIPTWDYPSNGTKIYRDTTETPPLSNGGMDNYPHGGKVHDTKPGIRTNADIEALANQGVVGDIPMYADEQGNARVAPRGGVYSAGRKKGQTREGVYNQPIDYEQLYWDKEEGVKNQFLAPADASAKVPNWVPKGGLSREQSQGMSNLISGYKNDQGIRDAIDRKNFSSNGELTREQAYKLLKKDPSLYKSANDKMIAGYDKVTQSEDRGWKNRLAHNIIDKPLNTGVALVDDLYSGVVQPVLNSARSIYNDPGQLGYIPDAFKAAGQTWMPETFGKTNASNDPEYWANAQKGYSAAENLINVAPIGAGLGAAKRIASPLAKSYSKSILGKSIKDAWNAPMGGIPHLSANNVTGAYFASKTPGHIKNLYDDPSLKNAAVLGLDVLGASNVIGAGLKGGKEMVARNVRKDQGKNYRSI